MRAAITGTGVLHHLANRNRDPNDLFVLCGLKQYGVIAGPPCYPSRGLRECSRCHEMNHQRYIAHIADNRAWDAALDYWQGQVNSGLPRGRHIAHGSDGVHICRWSVCVAGHPDVVAPPIERVVMMDAAASVARWPEAAS